MRYVPMDGVVITDERRFAFWDTVRDKFVDLDGDQSWTSVDDLESSFHFAVAAAKGAERVKWLEKRLVGLARGNGALEHEPADL